MREIYYASYAGGAGPSSPSPRCGPNGCVLSVDLLRLRSPRGLLDEPLAEADAAASLELEATYPELPVCPTSGRVDDAAVEIDPAS